MDNIIISQYVDLISKNNKYFVFHGLSLESYEITKKSFEFLNNLKRKKYINLKEIDKDLYKDFFNNRIILPEDFNEEKLLKNFRNKLIENRSKRDSVINNLRISVTDKCNLRCKYCFVAEQYSQMEEMKEEDFITIMRWHILSNKNNILFVQYFGGEPLLRLDLIKIGHSMLEESYRNGEINGYTEEIVTNGTLITKETARFLKEIRADIVFSIDGPKEINDENRVYRDGSGSYEDVLKGINNYRECDGNINLILTISESNVSNFKSVVNYLVKTIKPNSITLNGPQPYKNGWDIDGELFAKAIIKTWDICISNNINYYTPANSYIFAIKNKFPQVLSCADNGVYREKQNWGVWVDTKCNESLCLVQKMKTKSNITEHQFKKEVDDWHYDKELEIKCTNCRFVNVCSGICSIEKQLGAKINLEKCRFTEKIVEWIISYEE